MNRFITKAKINVNKNSEIVHKLQCLSESSEQFLKIQCQGSTTRPTDSPQLELGYLSGYPVGGKGSSSGNSAIPMFEPTNDTVI